MWEPSLRSRLRSTNLLPLLRIILTWSQSLPGDSSFFAATFLLSTFGFKGVTLTPFRGPFPLTWKKKRKINIHEMSFTLSTTLVCQLLFEISKKFKIQTIYFWILCLGLKNKSIPLYQFYVMSCQAGHASFSTSHLSPLWFPATGPYKLAIPALLEFPYPLPPHYRKEKCRLHLRNQYRHLGLVIFQII